jgi:uncharacterized membrane protein YhaH (DUF805 family)
MNYYLDVLKKYAVFDGRARRKEYWMFFLWSLIVNLVLGLVLYLIGRAIHNPATFYLIYVYSLAVAIPSLALTARRLHDTDHSAWWLLIYLAAPITLGITEIMLLNINQPLHNTSALWSLVIINLIISLLFLIGSIMLFVFTVTDSQPGTNQYGSNPKGATAS